MLTICGYANSSVEKYADSNEFKFVSLTPPPTSKGDVNGDGEIDEMDAMLASRYSAGMLDLTPDQLAAADVNGDGEVDEMDAMLISRYSAGLIELTAKPKPNDNKVVELEEIPD